MRENTCFFTGHRDLSGACTVSLKSEIRLLLEDLYRKGYRKFISGGARGFDTLAAEVVMDARAHLNGISLCTVVPHGGHDRAWGIDERKALERIRHASDVYIVLSEIYFQGCFHVRNRWMADRSSHCISYYNGLGRGGTAYTANYALEKGCIITNLYEK